MPITAASRISATTPHPMRRAGDIVIDRDQPAGKTVDRETESVALTSTEPPLRSMPVSSQVARPDASFVTHLIATAAQVPQTRVLRRADIADVEAAYRATVTIGSAHSRTSRVI